MTSRLISKSIPIENELKQSSYAFHAFFSDSADVVFGSFDCFDQNHKALDFCERENYLPLTKAFPHLSFASLEQVHSNNIKIIELTKGENFSNFGSGDGLITEDNNLALSIRTADCLPLFLWNKQIVSLLHIGYQGLLKGILDTFMHLLQNNWPSKQMNVAIGTHIQECCFEVKDDVLNCFQTFSLFHKHDIIARNGKTFLSLRPMIKRWFEKSFQGTIHDLSVCTCCHNDLHSYRRNKTIKRMGHIIFKRSVK